MLPNGTADQPFIWCGRFGMMDDGNGLHYARMRYVRAKSRQFLSLDPIPGTLANLQTFNRYSYAGNNPIVLHDASGQTWGQFFEGAWKGDFSSRDTGWSGLAGQTIVGLIPGVGQIADARDSLAALRRLRHGGWKQKAVWGGVGLAAVGWVPVVGDLAKGGLRSGRRLVKGANDVIPQVLKNRITGNAARDAIADSRPGSLIEQNFRVTGGLRRVDVLDGTTAIESKVGRTSLTSGVRQQLSRDGKLIRSGQVDAVEWHFSVSPTTSLGGPTGPLRSMLEEFGITIIEY